MPDTDTLVDDEVLEDAQFENAITQVRPAGVADAPPQEDPAKKEDRNTSYTQWALGGNSKFSPVGLSVAKLPAGVYEAFTTPGTWGVEQMKVSSDEIYELPDMATNTVLQEADSFWNNEDRYRKHNLLYKRGIILYGPPGSGKTVTIKLLIKKLIDRDGIVLLVQSIPISMMALKALKRIEPNRNIICIFEDIDEILYQNGEATVLSMLDGEHNVDRVMNIATTNYPDKLGARIINRPSRFDRRICIGMPTADSRRFYLGKTTQESLSLADLDKWVDDTDGMSIAHLRELVAAVYCLGQPYEEVINRLSEMANKVKVGDEFKQSQVGFKSGASTRGIQKISLGRDSN